MWWRKNPPLLMLTPSDVVRYTFANTSGETQHLRILSGDYEGIVFAYNNVRVHEETEQARFEFTFDVVENPNLVDTSSESFTMILGDILVDVIESQMEQGKDFLNETRGNDSKESDSQ